MLKRYKTVRAAEKAWSKRHAFDSVEELKKFMIIEIGKRPVALDNAKLILRGDITIKEFEKENGYCETKRVQYFMAKLEDY